MTKLEIEEEGGGGEEKERGRVGEVEDMNVIFLSRPRGRGCSFGARLVLACLCVSWGARYRNTRGEAYIILYEGL